MPQREKAENKHYVPPSRIEEVVSWLLFYLESGPRLVREVKKTAAERGIPPTWLRRATDVLPIIRRPRELRGPWIWKLPDDSELVLVRYRCPMAECSRSFEGWMEFGPSRRLFSAGLIRYLTRGRAPGVRPNKDKDELRVLVASPPST